MKETKKSNTNHSLANQFDAIVMRLRPRNFTAGFLSALALSSLAQDWYGKEGYINLVRENWIDSYFTIPLAIVILFYVTFFRSDK